MDFPASHVSFLGKTPLKINGWNTKLVVCRCVFPLFQGETIFKCFLGFCISLVVVIVLCVSPQIISNVAVCACFSQGDLRCLVALFVWLLLSTIFAQKELTCGWSRSVWIVFLPTFHHYSRFVHWSWVILRETAPNWSSKTPNWCEETWENSHRGKLPPPSGEPWFSVRNPSLLFKRKCVSPCVFSFLFSLFHRKMFAGWWLNQPIWKIWFVKLDHLPS